MQNNIKNHYTLPLFFIGCLFFSYGFLTWANSTLIPYLKIACELTDTQSYFVATAFFAAYFVMALPSSYILNKIGFKKGMSLGLLIMGIGALLFIPAANTRSYPLFLTGLFIIGTGMALLQTASNPYVAVLGPIESAAKRISIMGICNKLAGIISIYVLSSIILNNADGLKAHIATLSGIDKTNELNLLAQKVVLPYTITAIVAIALAILFYFINLPEIKEEEVEHTQNQKQTSVFQFSHLWYGVFALFFYVGLEVISYDTFTGFGEFLGFPIDTAKHFATYTGYGLLAGYVLSIIAIPKFISQRKALVVAVITSIVLVIISSFAKGYLAVFCFALLGFSNSVMWPAIFPLSIDKLGKFTKIGSAFLVMAIVGGAILPPLYAKIGQMIASKQLAYLMMVPCYLYILFFAVKGFRIKS